MYSIYMSESESLGLVAASVESLFERLQRLSYHYIGWKVIPVNNCSWEEGVFMSIDFTVYSSELFVMTSSAFSQGVRAWVVIFRYFYMFVGNLVEKSQPAVEPPMLESLPAELLNNGCCRCLLACASVRDVLHKSSRSFLYHLDLVDVLLSVRVPNTRTIFKLWTDRRLVCLFFDVLRTSTQISAKETQHSSCSATSYIYVFFPLELSGNSNPKIEGTIDVVQGFSIHFICCINSIFWHS